MARVMILGAGGMLGHKVCQCLTGHTVLGTLRRATERYRSLEVFDDVDLIGEVDVMGAGTVEEALAAHSPDVIVNCVGIVKQSPQSEDRLLSVGVNAYLPHRLARWCEDAGARLIHISTDCVFDGQHGHYTEDDPSNATDLYGKTKHLGETDNAETAAVTLRTSIIGRELTLPGHGLLEWFLANRGKTVKGFARAIFSGLTTVELARVIQRVIDEGGNLSGLYHVAAKPINKYDLLVLLRSVYGLDTEILLDEQVVCDRSLVMGPFSELTGYAAPLWETMIREMHSDPTPYDRYARE